MGDVDCRPHTSSVAYDGHSGLQEHQHDHIHTGRAEHMSYCIEQQYHIQMNTYTLVILRGICIVIKGKEALWIVN